MISMLIISTASGAQQAPRDSGSASAIEGTYSFSIMPQNKEPLIGTIAIRLKAGRATAIFTSPKLQEPEPADSVSIVDGKVWTSVLSGVYTFEFTMRGNAITDAKYTKLMNGRIEEGPAAIRRTTP